VSLLILLKILCKSLAKISIVNKAFFLNNTAHFAKRFNSALNLVMLSLIALDSRKIKIISDQTYYTAFR
jgi:hypothetical protein